MKKQQHISICQIQDTIFSIILGEQPSSEIRKIRDERFIDNPDIAQPLSKPLPQKDTQPTNNATII